MAFSIVGDSWGTAAASSSPQTFTLPLPTGTSLGDLIAVWTATDADYSTTDTRLTKHAAAGTVALGLFTGVATTLSDVTIDADIGWRSGMTYMVAVTGGAATERFGEEGPVATLGTLAGDGISGPNVGDPFGFAVCCVFDEAAPPATVGLGTVTSGPWVALSECPTYPAIYEYYDGAAYWRPVSRAYYLDGSASLTALDSSAVPGFVVARYARTVYYDPATGTFRTYLRQRQSPVRAPSRVRPPVVRQRQRPEIT